MLCVWGKQEETCLCSTEKVKRAEQGQALWSNPRNRSGWHCKCSSVKPRFPQPSCSWLPTIPSITYSMRASWLWGCELKCKRWNYAEKESEQRSQNSTCCEQICMSINRKYPSLELHCVCVIVLHPNKAGWRKVPLHRASSCCYCFRMASWD